MAKEDNLIPFTEMTPSEHSELSRKGQKASVAARKQKASFKKAIKWLAESDIKITQGKIYDMYKEQGIDISKFTPTELATMGLWLGAVTGKNENFKTLMEGNNELLGDIKTITPEVEIKVIENKDLEKALYEDSD